MNPNKFRYLICPVCGGNMHTEQNTLKCEHGHSYDIASSGYVNLLPPHKKDTVPGDNKDMVRARRDFLLKGYYSPLADKLTEICNLYKPSVIADIGCGEGYYTSKLGCSGAYVMGFDISKFALTVASKRDKASDYCVANLHELPIADCTADAVFCCFCAYDAAEFARILNTDGKFVFVTPARRHLFGLKGLLYEKPYENDETLPAMEGFRLISSERIEYTADIKGTDDIMNLFAMTPYFWKTPKSGADKLKALDCLTTEVAFAVNTYVKL